MVSVIHDVRLEYPREEYFSPDRSWPEYPFAHFSKRPNPVYGAVRECLAGAELDRANFDTPAWNPLGRYIRPGQQVFLLCNFVEQRVSGTETDFFSKCTHGSVIRAFADYVLIALKGEGAIYIGNSPLQSADWEKVTRETGADQVETYYRKFGPPGVSVRLTDLRQHIIRRSTTGNVSTHYHSDGEDDAVKVSLDLDSLLEELYEDGRNPRFRVLDYDYRRTEKCHARNVHTYIINRKIIESDAVISIPKLKTHEKVGITCAIKGCVGTVAHKDCLAHHRFGPPSEGGDEMPDRLSALSVISTIHDKVYSHEAGTARTVMHSADYFSRKLVRRFTRALSGSWPGNDTCWRMAVDLARILKFADKSGRMQVMEQRPHLALTDGIVGGEGDGPLSPRAVRLGYLSFSDDVVLADYVNALAMGFEPAKLPMIDRAFKLDRYSLSDANPFAAMVTLNGKASTIETLRQEFPCKFQPATEWRGTL